jgi:hypothetical protein
MNGMTEEGMKHMAQMMAQQGSTMGPMQAGMVAAGGYAAGRGLLGGALLRNPLVLLAAGIAAGYFMHKYQDEIMLALAKGTGMGKDFLLQQKENLADLIEETKDKEEQQAKPEQPAA